MEGHDARHTGQSPYKGKGPAKANLKWRFETGAPVQSSPAIGTDGTVYVGSSAYLYALNPDGNLEWQFMTVGDVLSSPAIASDGTIYVGALDSYLYALLSDGGLKWRFKTGNSISSSPAISSDGTVYVGADDKNLYALNPDGSLKWQFKTGGDVLSSPAIASDGTIYVGASESLRGKKGYLYALNPDGSFKWSLWTKDQIYSSPAIGLDGTVYIGCNDNYLYALDPDGNLKWEFQTGGDVTSSPAIASDGTIYVGADSYLYVLTSDGKLSWTFKMDGQVSSSPVIGLDGTLYVGALDNNLYAWERVSDQDTDINQDGIVDLLDLVAIGKDYNGCCCNINKYSPEAARFDVNGDRIVDKLDLEVIKQHFSKEKDSDLATKSNNTVVSNPTEIWLTSRNQESDAPKQLLHTLVMINTTTDLYGFQFDLDFSPEMMEVVSISEGDLLRRGYEKTYWFIPQIDQQMGKITGAAAIRLGTDRGVNEGGVLATIIFKLKRDEIIPKGNFVLENIKLVNSKEKYIPVFGRAFTLEEMIRPQRTEICQNYPNPFNLDTWIPYKLSETNEVIICIYNLAGQIVRKFELGHQNAGLYLSQERATYWNGRNDFGEKVSSGVYFYTIKAGNFRATRRMAIMK